MRVLARLLPAMAAAVLSAALLFILSLAVARPLLEDAVNQAATAKAREAPGAPGASAGMGDMGTWPPPSSAPKAFPGDAVRFLSGERDLGRMSALARITALASRIGSGPVTLFAPTDEAFDRMTAPTYLQLLEAANAPLLISTVRHHAVAGAFSPQQLERTKRLRPLEGTSISVEASSGGMLLDGHAAVTERVRVADGWVYRLDEVLTPDVR